MSGRSSSSLLRTLTQNPIVSVVLIVVVCWWVANLGYGSAAARVFEGNRTHCWWGHMPYLHRGVDHKLCISAKRRPDSFASLDLDYRWHNRGLLALTHRRLDHTMSVYLEAPDFPNLSMQECDQARVLYADMLEADGVNAHVVELIRSGDGITTEPIPGGYTKNAAILALVTLATWSLGWVRRVNWDDLLQTRAQRWAKEGRCTQCGYDLRGISPGLCPECGNSSEQRATSQVL